MCSRLKNVEYENQFKKESEGVEKKKAKTYKQPKQPNDRSLLVQVSLHDSVQMVSF